MHQFSSDKKNPEPNTQSESSDNGFMCLMGNLADFTKKTFWDIKSFVKNDKLCLTKDYRYPKYGFHSIQTMTCTDAYLFVGMGDGT